MNTTITIIFILGYLAIVLEHTIRVNKTASAMLTAAVGWACYALFSNDHHLVLEQLREHLIDAAGVILFLMGAMTVVEIIDSHGGFSIVTRMVRTRNMRKLLWIVAWITFFLSAVLDNLATTIVMISLVRKLLARSEDRITFAGIIIIAANAGGAWSPIGDVTTTMLWIGGQVSTPMIVTTLFLPSVANLLIPLMVVSFWMRGEVTMAAEAPRHEMGLTDRADPNHVPAVPLWETRLVFALGTGGLLFVPVFKTVTHLPPWLGILFGLGILWVTTDLLHRDKDVKQAGPFGAAHALSRIDMSSALFFAGILLAVGALQAIGQLSNLASWLDRTIGNTTAIVILLGFFSAVVDNVPLVAAAMGMYPMTTYPVDHYLWEFIAYSAGTGGSMLVIGSAAGVAAMGMEKLHFGWYLKKIAPLALLGFLAGAAVYELQFRLFPF